MAVGAREVRAILVERGVVSCHASAPFRGVDSLAAAISRVLGELPKSAFAARVGVAISPAWVQVKQLHGLPSLNSARLVNQLVRENQQAFFLWNGGPTAIPDIDVRSNGRSWGASFQKDVLDELVRSLRNGGLDVARVAPTLVALTAVIPNTPIRWIDGDALLELEGDGSGLASVATNTSGSAHDTLTVPAELEALGPDGYRFVDAYAAAMAPRRLTLVWDVESDEHRRRVVQRAKCAASIFAIAGAATFAALGPGIRAARYARVAEHELFRQHDAQLELARSQSELRRVTQMLNRVETFRGERGKITRFLAALSRAVPESTAILMFHVDSVEGVFTAIAPHVSDALPELVNIAEIVGPRIVGSVTREVFGGVRVERASFRFRRARSTSASGERGTR